MLPYPFLCEALLSLGLGLLPPPGAKDLLEKALLLLLIMQQEFRGPSHCY